MEKHVHFSFAIIVGPFQQRLCVGFLCQLAGGLLVLFNERHDRCRDGMAEVAGTRGGSAGQVVTGGSNGASLTLEGEERRSGEGWKGGIQSAG